MNRTPRVPFAGTGPPICPSSLPHLNGLPGSVCTGHGSGPGPGLKVWQVGEVNWAEERGMWRPRDKRCWRERRKTPAGRQGVCVPCRSHGLHQPSHLP